MRKIDIPDVNFDIDNLINDLRQNPRLANIEITETNVSDCLVYLEETANCSKCKGLEECKNHQNGYCLLLNKMNFELKKCRYKKEYDNKNQQNSLIETLYMPKNLQEATLENFKITTKERADALKFVNNFLLNYDKDKFQKGLFLCGFFGAGKTYLLAALQKELSKKNISSLLIYFPDLIRELKNSLGTPKFEQLMNNLKEIDVLMLDDLGSETMTPWLRDEIIGPILNYRLEASKSLFVSSNLINDQIRKHFILGNDPLDQTKASRIINRLFRLTDIFYFGNNPYKEEN